MIRTSRIFSRSTILEHVTSLFRLEEILSAMLARKKTQHPTSPEKTDDISPRHQQFPRERHLSHERRNSILMTVTTQICVVLLIG